MYYPIMVDVKDKNILIVGGGKVGYRKAKNFLDFQATVTVVSKNFYYDFFELNQEFKENLILIEDSYDKKYIKDSFLVVAATSSRILNEEISKECKEKGILCNAVDSLEESDFISTSVIRNGHFTLSISTMGKCPFLSKKIRKDLERNLDIDGEYVELLGDVRRIIISKYSHRKKELLDYCLDLPKEKLLDFYQALKEE